MPFAIYMMLSDDNKNFHYIGDLVSVSGRNGVPPATGYNHVFKTTDLPGRGRDAHRSRCAVGNIPDLRRDRGFRRSQRRENTRGIRSRWRMSNNSLTSTSLRRSCRAVWLCVLKAVEKETGLDPLELWREALELPEVTEIAWRKGLPYNAVHEQSGPSVPGNWRGGQPGRDGRVGWPSGQPIRGSARTV